MNIINIINIISNISNMNIMIIMNIMKNKDIDNEDGLTKRVGQNFTIFKTSGELREIIGRMSKTHKSNIYIWGGGLQN